MKHDLLQFRQVHNTKQTSICQFFRMRVITPKREMVSRVPQTKKKMPSLIVFSSYHIWLFAELKVKPKTLAKDTQTSGNRSKNILKRETVFQSSFHI